MIEWTKVNCPGCGIELSVPYVPGFTTPLNPSYNSLQKILVEAYEQAAEGKGAARHSSREPFDQQPICQISRSVGIGFALGQAMKKILESQRLPGEDGDRELLGAINYLAAAIIVRREFANLGDTKPCSNCEDSFPGKLQRPPLCGMR